MGGFQRLGLVLSVAYWAVAAAVVVAAARPASVRDAGDGQGTKDCGRKAHGSSSSQGWAGGAAEGCDVGGAGAVAGGGSGRYFTTT
jgi:hypothetical protein